MESIIRIHPFLNLKNIRQVASSFIIMLYSCIYMWVKVTHEVEKVKLAYVNQIVSLFTNCIISSALLPKYHQRNISLGQDDERW